MSSRNACPGLGIRCKIIDQAIANNNLQVATAIEALEGRLRGESHQRELSVKEKLILRLNQQYPRDVGVLAALFLNLVVLGAGQARHLMPVLERIRLASGNQKSAKQAHAFCRP